MPGPWAVVVATPAGSKIERRFDVGQWKARGGRQRRGGLGMCTDTDGYIA